MAADRTRTFRWEDPAGLADAALAQDGLAMLESVRDGRLPAPPIAAMLGMDLVSIQRGQATFALQPAEWMYNPIGSVHGGIAATILDSCLGCAIHSTMTAGMRYTTTDLQVRYVRAMSSDTGRVVAEGTVVHMGRRMATAEGRLVAEATGKLIAHASTACIIFA